MGEKTETVNGYCYRKVRGKARDWLYITKALQNTRLGERVRPDAIGAHEESEGTTAEPWQLTPATWNLAE
jgi:hypothetical protein